MEDLWRLSAADLAGLIRSKKVSAKEAAVAALARLDAVNPKINAVVDHRPADVLAQAAAIDAAIARNDDVGPLAGVPVTVKVNIDQQGFATTNGLKLQRDVIAATNSPVIDNLRKAGAVMILGRTNCPAFSYRWFTTNLVHGDTRNPRDAGITRVARPAARRRPWLRALAISRTALTLRDRSAIRLCLRRSLGCGRPSAGSRHSMRRCPNARSGPQISAVSGPLGAHHRRSQDWACGDVRLRRARSLVGAGAAARACDAEAGRHVVFAPMVLRPQRKWRRRSRMPASGCSAPDGRWRKSKRPPPLREAADLQTKLWLGDNYEAQLETAEREGDPGALACLRGNRAKVVPFDAAAFSKA